MGPRTGRVKISNPPVLIFRKQEYPVKPGILLMDALKSISLEPEMILAVRDGVVLQAEDILSPGDRIKIIARIAGG